MEKAFDPVKYRSFAEEPFLDIYIPSSQNPSHAPKGQSTVSVLVHFVPHHFDKKWTSEQKEKLGDTVIKTLTKYAVDLTSSIVSMEVLSPVDIENCYGLTNGHVFHGEHAIDQLISRPVPSCSRYKTPIKSLFLCGSGSHPGGGITCGPGALATSVILTHK